MSRVNWQTAYDKQMDLWGWWHTPAAVRMAEGYMQSVSTTGHGVAMQAEMLARGQREILFEADPVVLDDDMMTLVESAAETFPPEALRAEDILTPTAFVWLPRPFRLLDANSKYITVRAFSWGPVEYRVSGREVNKNQPLGDSPLRRGLMLSYYSWMGDAAVDDYVDHLRLYMNAYNIDLSMVHWEPWFFGESYEPHPDVPGAANTTLRFVQTMWRLMQQTIATMSHQQPQRAARRRAAKAGMPDKAVTVITLRRPKKPLAEDHEPTAVDWSHRWVTRGHWRNQWFPSLGPSADPTSHRQIWISDYIKGPEDKPLIVKRLRAFEWVQ